MKINACMADSCDSVVINPLGQLAKCDASIYEGIVGNVRDGILDCSYWQNTKNESMNCELCSIYPSCSVLEHCNAYLPCNTVEQTHKIEAKKIPPERMEIQAERVEIAGK